MGTFPRWTSIAALPLVMLFECMSWYAMRSYLFIHLHDIDYEVAEIGGIMATARGMEIVGTIAAAAVAIAIGPQIVLAIGVLLCAAGLFGMSATEDVMAPLLIGSFGIGFFRPAIYGAAAQALGGEREHGRTALFFVLYCMLNVGALTGPLLAARFNQLGDRSGVFTFSGVLATVSAFFALSLATIVIVVRSQKKTDKKPRPQVSRLIAVGVFAVIVALTWGGYSLWWELFYQAVRPLREGGEMELTTLLAYNPLTVIGLTIPAAFVFVLLQVMKVRFPVLILPGLGLLAVAIGALIVFFIDPQEPATGMLILSTVIVAVGEVLLIPIIMSKITADLPYRLGTAVAALWLLLTGVPSLILKLIDSQDGILRFMVGGCIASFTIVGLGLIFKSKSLSRLFAPETPATEDEDESDQTLLIGDSKEPT